MAETALSSPSPQPPVAVCPAGQYSTGLIQPSCAQCPSGNFCPGGGVSRPCDPGTYSSISGATVCQQCPLNWFSFTGSSSCTSCATSSVVPESQCSGASTAAIFNSSTLYTAIFIFAIVMPLLACVYNAARRRRAAAAAAAYSRANRAAAMAQGGPYAVGAPGALIVRVGGGQGPAPSRGLPPHLAALLAIDRFRAPPGEDGAPTKPAAAAAMQLPGVCVAEGVEPGACAPAQDGEGGERCVVCLCDYAEGDVLVVLPCGHRFHADACGLRWLATDSRCPHCKQDTQPLLRSIAAALGDA